MLSGRLWRHFDFWLFGAVLLLSIIGVAMIRSTTATSIDPALQELTSRQIIFNVTGIAIVFIFAAIDYRLWGSLSGAVYVGLIILLLLVEVLGVATFGAVRWIPLGIINLQPSELGKFLITLTVAAMVTRNADRIGQLPFVIQTLVHAGIPTAIVFLQPDLSTAIMYGVVWFTIMWAAGMRLSHLALFGGVTLALAPLLFFIMLQTDELQYMAQRLILFIIPDTSSQAYRDAIYNVNQSLISVGSGGWFGQGYGQGSQVQLRFLKVRHTDFIFSAIAHEFGFVGALVVILLMTFVVYRIFRAGQQARDPFGSYVCYGVAAIVLYQAFFNFGMCMDVLPVSGLPLPFVSYGGSSQWTFMIGLGLVQSVILRQNRIEF